MKPLEAFSHKTADQRHQVIGSDIINKYQPVLRTKRQHLDPVETTHVHEERVESTSALKNGEVAECAYSVLEVTVVPG